MEAPLPGSVLSDNEIERLCSRDELAADAPPLIEDFAIENLKGAAYDLRMADDGMVLPDGTVIRPGDRAYKAPIILEPGQTIFVSTRERLNLPDDLVGNMSAKGSFAVRGVLLLTGLIVDPRYRSGQGRDGRLHFRIANLGRRPVVLEPGRTNVASIQFIRLAEASSREPGPGFTDVWDRIDEFKEGLGFLDEMRHIAVRVESIDSELQRQVRVVNQVGIAVMFVVLATLLGASIAGLLALGSQTDLVEAAERVVPNGTSGQILGVAALFGLAAITYSLASVLRVRGARDVRDPAAPDYGRREALRSLRVERARSVSVAVTLAVIAALIGTAVITETTFPWWATLIIALAVGVVIVWRGWRHIWWPISMRRIDERLREWDQEKSE